MRRARPMPGCGTSPSPAISLLVSTTTTRLPSSSAKTRAASRKSVVLPTPGRPRIRIERPCSTTSRISATVPWMARPTRQVRPTTWPRRLRMALMRCSVRSMPARLSSPNAPIRPTTSSRSCIEIGVSLKITSRSGNRPSGRRPRSKTISRRSPRSCIWAMASRTRGGSTASRASRSSVIVCCIVCLFTFTQACGGCPYPFDAIQNPWFHGGNLALPQRAHQQMAHEQGVGGALLETAGAQGINDMPLVLADQAEYGPRRFAGEHAQGGAQQRVGDAWLVGMRHQPELMWLGTAPEAQSHPAAEPHAAIVDVGDAVRLDERQIPRTAAARARLHELVAGQPLRHLHTLGGAGVVEPQQAPGVVTVPGAQRYGGVSACCAAGIGARALRIRRIGGGEGVQTVRGGGQPVGQLAGVALEAELAEDFELGALVLDTREDTMHPAHDGGVQGVLHEFQQRLILGGGGGRLIVAAGHGGEEREVPGQIAGAGARLRNTEGMPVFFADPGGGVAGEGEEGVAEGGEAASWLVERLSDHEVGIVAVPRPHVAVEGVEHARQDKTRYRPDHPGMEPLSRGLGGPLTGVWHARGEGRVA